MNNTYRFDTADAHQLVANNVYRFIANNVSARRKIHISLLQTMYPLGENNIYRPKNKETKTLRSLLGRGSGGGKIIRRGERLSEIIALPILNFAIL